MSCIQVNLAIIFPPLAGGHVYKKIREGFENVRLLLPVIEKAEGGVKVTLQRRNQGNPISDFGKDFGKDFGTELSERQLLILELIALNPSLSAKAISEKVSEKMSEKVSGKASITDRTIENDMAKLKKMGILTHEGSRKEGRWIIVKTKFSK